MKIETVKCSKTNKTKNELGGLTMKKTFFVVLLAVMALVLVNGVSSAAITGTCGNCHTMHNSQDGTSVTQDDAGNLTTTPRDYLLIGGCVYCHVDSGAGKTAAGGGWNVADDNSFPSGYFNATAGTACGSASPVT